MRKWVDPPEGWRHGFPKIFDPDKDGDLYDWLIREGYTEQDITDSGKYFYTRQWDVDPCGND